MKKNSITYTYTDESPALATSSFYPIIEKILKKINIKLEKKDISLVARILSSFPEYLEPLQRIDDDLGYLAKTIKQAGANIIKLPNISASTPQLQAAISELQKKGFALPDYPENPSTKEEQSIRNRYEKIKGSAVNPVLRQGNSDRRAPKSIKDYARKHPHTMNPWSKDSPAHVSSMSEGDFYHSEQSYRVDQATQINIRLKTADESIILKEKLNLIEGEIIDISTMNKDKLQQFISEQIEDAKKQGLLFSVHLKATMMKVSDPVIFGHVVRVFFQPVFDKYSALLEKVGADADHGLGDILSKIELLPPEQRQEIEQAIATCYQERPPLAMVNSDENITSLHFPNDVIIDASMPAAIRNAGCMYNQKGELQATKFVIPDSSYAGIYQKTIEFCKKNGAFDPTTMGSVSNVGLMAQKAEEYGSHDKTFIIEQAGLIEIVDNNENILLTQEVQAGDIFRMCQTKENPIASWVKLAVERATITQYPLIFWLDDNRAHDRELIKRVEYHLSQLETTGLDIKILNLDDATQASLEIIAKGENTISASGNVLRDYLTDLFPILEVGTSSKMLSIVPLMNGGAIFETGAGGSAPKLTQQFIAEGHFAWDSLGEYLALAGSLAFFARKNTHEKAAVMSQCFDIATAKFLDERKSPVENTDGIDTKTSQFYFLQFLLEALSDQQDDVQLAQLFDGVREQIKQQEDSIISELSLTEKKAVDLGGYYYPDAQKLYSAVSPSQIFNKIWQDF